MATDVATKDQALRISPGARHRDLSARFQDVSILLRIIRKETYSEAVAVSIDEFMEESPPRLSGGEVAHVSQ